MKTHFDNIDNVIRSRRSLSKCDRVEDHKVQPYLQPLLGPSTKDTSLQ
jgi:hypothetical protein